jgi:hypothetical protein
MLTTGGSTMEFETKRQRNNYFRSVNTIINDGPVARPESITFTKEDFRLKSTNHNDAMVIEVNIAGWIIRKILVDNGSSADILFLRTFEEMNLSQHMLHPPEYSLLGFGGKPIKLVGKNLCLYHEILTMSKPKHYSTWSTCITCISRFSAEVS